MIHTAASANNTTSAADLAEGDLSFSIVSVEDAPAEIPQLIYDSLYRDFNVSFDPIEQWYNGSLGGQFIVARDSSGSLLGLCRLMPSIADNPHAQQVRQVVVSAKKQGLGVGKQLMEHAQNMAKAQGCKELFLWSRYPAYGFYENLGYHFFSDEWTSSLTHINYRTMVKAL